MALLYAISFSKDKGTQTTRCRCFLVPLMQNIVHDSIQNNKLCSNPYSSGSTMGSKVVLNSGNHYCRSVSLSEPTKKQGKKTPHKSLTEPLYANRIHKDLCNVLLGRYSRVHSLCSHRKRRLQQCVFGTRKGRNGRRRWMEIPLGRRIPVF